MTREKWPARLGILFILAVVVPSIALVFIAVRAAGREEAYIEKSLENTLQAEVTHLVSLVKGELANILKVLRDTAPSNFEFFSGQALIEWQNSIPLVDIPYLISPSFEILWPGESPDNPYEVRFFLEQNRDFFSGRTFIPVYRNIAAVYSDEILGKDSQVNSGYVQQAVTEFARDESLRSEVYKQAAEEGQIALQRNVMPNQMATKGEGELPASIFVSQLQGFQEIIASGDYGIIPRFIQDRLVLLFWKREGSRGFVGCIINEGAFRERIISRMPDVYTTVRILTILEENGWPLITVEEARDWTRPFVAREISEILPRWEVAAYLTDPEFVTSRAAQIKRVIWILIILLFVSIAGGGTLVLKGLYSEMALAGKKTTFVANVSHELKTPLTSIRMFAEMLREGRQPDAEKRKRYLEIMVSESERLTRLINNVLDFARSGKEREYHMKRVDLDLLCLGVVENQRVRLEQNGFSLAFRTGGAIPVSVDEEAIKQTFLNILSNAEKYSDRIKEIVVETKREDDCAVIRILDRGIGIPPRHSRNIFKEFFRMDDRLTARVRGTGLGLTISLKIIRDHGGDLKFYPRDGGGSLFRIALPLIEDRL